MMFLRIILSLQVTHIQSVTSRYTFDKLGKNYEDYVIQNPKFMRPEELKFLKGDSTPIREELGWEPEYTFDSMLDEMIEFWMNNV